MALEWIRFPETGAGEDVEGERADIVGGAGYGSLGGPVLDYGLGLMDAGGPD